MTIFGKNNNDSNYANWHNCVCVYESYSSEIVLKLLYGTERYFLPQVITVICLP